MGPQCHETAVHREISDKAFFQDVVSIDLVQVLGSADELNVVAKNF